MKRSKIALWAVINLSIFLFGVAALEMVFGGWLKDVGFERLNLIRNQTILFPVASLYGGAGKTAIYTRDRYGFRGKYSDVSQIDILTVGGSTTDQRYIADDHTWQQILQNNFVHHGLNINVVNAGVDGQTTFGHIHNFHYWFPKIRGLKVKYVLFYIGLNDVFSDDSTPFDLLVRKPGKWSWREQIMAKSALYHLSKVIRGIAIVKTSKLGHKSVDFTQIHWTDRPLANHHNEMLGERLL